MAQFIIPDRNTSSEMRYQMGWALSDLAYEFPQIRAFDADLRSSTGLHIFEHFHPEKLIKAGIAEQLMISMAAGFSQEGFIPFTCTFDAFSRRFMDQLYVTVAYSDLNVKMIGAYAGLFTGKAGASHQSDKELGFLLRVPRLTVLEPSCNDEMRQALRIATTEHGPFYLRLVRCSVDENSIYPGYEFRVGRGVTVLDDGYDAGLITTGQSLAQAFSKTMRSVPDSEASALLGQYFRVVSQYGADSEEADEFMRGELSAIPALQQQIMGILNNSGIYNDGFSQLDRDRARPYVVEGMKAGLSGETKVDYMQNRAWDLAAKAALEDPKEDPFGVMTVTGGLDTVKSRSLDRRQAVLDVLSYDKVNGEFTTPEIIDLKRRIADNPAKDLILSDINLMSEIESIIGSPEEAEGYSPGLASAIANPDFVKRDSSGRVISRMSFEEAKNKLGDKFEDKFAEYMKALRRQRNESSAFNSSVEQSYYLTNKNDYRALVDAQETVRSLVDIGRLISPEDASEVELKANIKRYLDYERAASAMERRTIIPQFESTSEESNYVNNLLNVAIASLGEGQYSAVEVVDERGNTRARNASEAEALLPLLQDSSKFSITGNLNPISKDGKRSSGLKVTFVGDNNNPPANYIIHEDSLDAALRHTNRIYDHLTDFSIGKIRDPQVISGAQYNSPDMLYNIKWSEEKDGVQTALSGQILQSNIINILSNLNKKKKK